MSNDDRPAAMIILIGETESALDGLVARGQARPTRVSVESLASIIPSPAGRTTQEMIEDARGSW